MFDQRPGAPLMPESYGAALAAVVQSYVYMAAIVRYPTGFCWVSGLSAPASSRRDAMDKREYDEWLRGLIEQGRDTPSPIDVAKPYVDAGDLDELDDEDLEDEDEDEDEESTRGRRALRCGLSPTIEQLLSGNVVWYDPATLMHDASVGLGKDTDMKSADDRANEQFDLHCARGAGIAQEMASRLARDPRETKNWSLFAGGRMEPSVRLNGMFTFLRYSLDPGHQALLDRLVDETQKDLDRVEDVRARRGSSHATHACRDAKEVPRRGEPSARHWGTLCRTLATPRPKGQSQLPLRARSSGDGLRHRRRDTRRPRRRRRRAARRRQGRTTTRSTQWSLTQQRETPRAISASAPGHHSQENSRQGPSSTAATTLTGDRSVPHD